VQRFHRLFEALQQQTGIPFSELYTHRIEAVS